MKIHVGQDFYSLDNTQGPWDPTGCDTYIHCFFNKTLNIDDYYKTIQWINWCLVPNLLIKKLKLHDEYLLFTCFDALLCYNVPSFTNRVFVHCSPSPSQTSKECSCWGFSRLCDCVCVCACMWIKHSYPLLCGGTHLQGTWVHRVTHTHTHGLLDMHDCAPTTCCSVCFPSTCTAATWRKHTAVLSYSLHYYMLLSFFLSFCYSSFPSFFFCPATQCATSEKVISDSSLYWD